MIKNVLMVMLACFVFMLAGCGDNGSADTSYINIPVKYFDQVIANVSDDKNWPFEGATIVLTHTNGTEYSFELDDNIECDFGELPYGRYTAEIPGYSGDINTFTVDADYIPEDLVFKRLTVGITVPVNGTTISSTDLVVSISDGLNDVIHLTPVDSQQAVLFQASGVPAGRYYLGVYDATDIEHKLIAYQTIDINANSTNFPTAVSATEITYGVVGIPVEKGTRVKAMLAGKKADGIYWNEYYAAYTAIFLLTTAGTYRVDVTADGFNDFSDDLAISLGSNNFIVPMITPIGQAKTVAIYDFIIHDSIGAPIPQGTDVTMTVNGKSADHIVYVSRYMNIGTSAGVYVARFYLSALYPAAVPMNITAIGYEPLNDTVAMPAEGYNMTTMSIIKTP